MIRLFTRPLLRVFRRPDLILMRLVAVWIFAGALIVLVAGCDSRANNDSANHTMPPPEVAPAAGIIPAIRPAPRADATGW